MVFYKHDGTDELNVISIMADQLTHLNLLERPSKRIFLSSGYPKNFPLKSIIQEFYFYPNIY